MPSAYVQELKFSPPIEGGFDNVKARVLARPPSWFDLVRRIRAAAPAVPLRVWRQEDYRREPLAILAALCGRDPGPLPAMEDPSGRSRRSRRHPRRRGAARGHAARGAAGAGAGIFRASGDGARFDPFTPGEKALLRTAYARDLERIAGMDPGILIRV